MPGLSRKLQDVLGLAGRRPPEFYRSRDTIRCVPYANTVRRAWDAMGLNGVLYLGRSPAVYFKELDETDPVAERKLHRQLWNHGTAPILIVSTPREVLVYSGQALPADDDEEPRKGSRLVRILERVKATFEDEARQLLPSIETGHIYSEKPDCFNPGRSVDRDLLKNLMAVRYLLGQGPQALQDETIDALLTRLIFVCYLIERKIVKGSHFADPRLRRINAKGSVRGLLDGYGAEDAHDVLYTLFDELRVTGNFNGSLFEAGLDRERQMVRPAHMGIVQRFLQAEDLGTGQKALPFWAYDFSMIPIETISAIYQDFIASQGQNEQRKSGAYYTPPHLAELVVDTAIEGWGSLLGKKALDPACGSGIFLVSMFNRMAEDWHTDNPKGRNSTRAKDLIGILQENLWGVDKHGAACRITCFSLYLALLDQLKPRDIQHLQKQGHVLPPLFLAEGDCASADDPRPIIQGNFLHPSLPVQKKQFDLVIGNPPWVSRTGDETDPLFKKWCRDHRDLPVPQRQISCGFMWEAPDYLKTDGRACLLLPSAVLRNDTTNKFQKAWFRKYRVDHVLNLSDLRHLIFSGAKHPGTILRFAGVPPESPDSVLQYSVPKVEPRTLYGGPVYVAPDDRKPIRLSRILNAADHDEAPLLWKTYLWGTPRDLRLLERLQDLPPLEDLVGTPKARKQWVRGQGFKPFVPRADRHEIPKKAWWSEDELYLDAKKAFDLVLLGSDADKVGKRFRLLHRAPDAQVFQGPMVVASQGFSKIAFAEDSLLFQHSLQSISGGARDIDLLMFLSAILNSSLAKYFLFHTAANWGTERDKVQFFELLRMPFPLPDQAPDAKQAKEALEKVVARMKRLKQELGKAKRDMDGRIVDREKIVGRAKKEMEPWIYAYYDIDDWEKDFIEDTVNILEPSSTPISPDSEIRTLDQPTLDEREAYVSLVCEALNSWGRRSDYKVNGEAVCAPEAGAALVTFQLQKKAHKYKERIAPTELNALLADLQHLLPLKSRSLIALRDLKVFDRMKLHILKPMALRYWTRTAAINDADEIAAAILMDDEEPGT